MRGLTFHGARDVRVEQVADPVIVAPTDAIVRVELSAVCGSDLHVYHEREIGMDHGAVMGHEFVGRVVEVGAEVRAIRRDDRVLSPFTTSCGRCFFCRRGLTARCATGQLFGWVGGGAGLHGGQAELVRVPLADGTLVPVPDDVGLDEALLLGDVLSTGFYCAERAELRGGDTAVVLGCGPVGLMAVLGARERGVERPIAVDTVPERLALAERFGAQALDFAATDVAARVREQTEGRGADAVLEAVGSPGAARLAVDLVRPGGTISTVGVHTAASFAFSPVEAYDKNLTYRIGRCPARAMIDRLIPVVQRGDRAFGAIVTHRMALDDAAEAYALFDAKRDGCIKVVLGP